MKEWLVRALESDFQLYHMDSGLRAWFLLLFRMFPLLSLAHDGNEAHCEDILANGGGGFFRSVGVSRMGREQAKWQVGYSKCDRHLPCGLPPFADSRHS